MMLVRENELKHYGILGMKWGVRRYQNEDGSLTVAGQKRYGVNSLNTKSRNFSESSSNKQKARLLNDVDQTISAYKRDFNDASTSENKYKKKAAKAKNTASRDKYLNKASKYTYEKGEALKKINKGKQKNR